MNEKEILITGTGAMACLFAARLAPFTNVTMLGTWGQAIAELKEKGVRIVEADGTEQSHPVMATSSVKDCAGIHYAIVLVKSWQTERVAEQLSKCLHPEGIAITLQNGVGNLETLQQALGYERAALGVTTSGATLLGPGRVRVGGVGVTHIFPHPKLSKVIDYLKKAGFEIHASDDLESLIWGKLVVNAGINPLTAILQVPNGELLNLPDAQLLMSAAAEEVAVIARRKGIELPYNDPVDQVAEVARKTAPNFSSMYQDVQRGAPTEIDAICGVVVREGQKLGEPTPVNETLWHLVRALASREGE
ncbi:MAG: 2-dehydropantoate 2-reductase [Anaerolineales bacterium]|nr:2-dehydropantoate 2-reductase [Anaerolineales bacterium]